MDILVNWNLVGRMVVAGIGIVLLGYWAFFQTPELNAVEDKFYRGIYRLSFFLLQLNGWYFVWFKMLGVFPID